MVVLPEPAPSAKRDRESIELTNAVENHGMDEVQSRKRHCITADAKHTARKRAFEMQHTLRRVAEIAAAAEATGTIDGTPTPADRMEALRRRVTSNKRT